MDHLNFDYDSYTRGFNYGWEALEKDKLENESDVKALLIQENRSVYNDLIQSVEAITDPVGLTLMDGVRDALSVFKENVIEPDKSIEKDTNRDLEK